MGLEQMAATAGGRRFKRPYVEEINARTPYLPGLHQQKKTDQYRDKMYGLEERKLAQDKKFGLENLDLARDAQREVKKRNKTAKTLGYANIGLGAGLGILDNYDTIKSGVSSMFPSIGDVDVPGGVTSFSPGQDFGGIMESMTKSPSSNLASNNILSPIDWVSGITDSLKNVGNAAFDFGSGLYESLTGPALDMDWDWDFADSMGF